MIRILPKTDVGNVCVSVRHKRRPFLLSQQKRRSAKQRWLLLQTRPSATSERRNEGKKICSCLRNHKVVNQPCKRVPDVVRLKDWIKPGLFLEFKGPFSFVGDSIQLISHTDHLYASFVVSFSCAVFRIPSNLYIMHDCRL